MSLIECKEVVVSTKRKETRLDYATALKEYSHKFTSKSARDVYPTISTVFTIATGAR
ncbi:MAG TPA: hypothetical protein VED16_03245 [Candidatus Acidoferrum sp.]|nr:hypothetical protein [Candidatus Acidoferrum sp.]